MIVRTPKQREDLVEGGRRIGEVLAKVARAVVPGITTEELDDLAEKLIRDLGDEPSFLGYQPEGARRPFPATLCVSINDEVVHGIPSPSRKLKTGDIVSLDLGLTHHGLILDSAVTVPVGKVKPELLELIAATDAALEAGIAAARPGNRTGDISRAIGEAYKGTGFAIVRVLGGHGVGEHVHEEPFIANYGKGGDGVDIVPGMVLALEPIATLGKASVVLSQDGYTYRTKDGSAAAHSEHTILIEEKETVVLTRRPGEV
ncbi:MAG: type I methionyl aminopeptidase [bacterium]